MIRKIVSKPKNQPEFTELLELPEPGGYNRRGFHEEIYDISKVIVKNQVVIYDLLKRLYRRIS